MTTPVPVPAGFAMPATAALLHENVGVGVVLLVILYEFEMPLHHAVAEGLVITIVGLTVTVRSKGIPSQLFTVGVIR